MKKVFLVVCALGLCGALILSGCGGASAPASVGPDEGNDVVASAVNKGDLPDDPQAEQATKYCEHSINKSVNQPPDSLDRKQIQACLTAIRPQMKAKCSKGIKRSLVLKIIVEKTGTVGDAFALGDGADSPEASCVAEMVKEVKFPQFKGSAQQVIQKYPFEL